MRGHLIAKLPNEPADGKQRLRCDCGWLRPQFVDLRAADKTTPLNIGTEFYLLFDCPECGARWDARYGEVP